MNFLGRVALAELRALPQGKQWLVEQHIAGLESLTPVRGRLVAIHHGTALEVKADVETIVTLCCARCLQQYNHVLRAEVRELMGFCGPESGLHDVQSDDLSLPLPEDIDDRLEPAGSFNPERWLFEQLSLQFPLVNRCGQDCPGPASWGTAPTPVDPRWEALKALTHPTP